MALDEQRLRALRLVGIADAGLAPWAELEARVCDALRAGLPAVMLRDRGEATDAELLPVARRIHAVAMRQGALLIVNRRPEIARELAGCALHLGAQGPTLEEAREVLSEAAAIGYSAHSVDEGLKAFARGFDYVTLSPIFATPSKPECEHLGLGPLRELCAADRGPVVALGGLTAERIAPALEAGARGVAMIRAVFEGDAQANVERLLAAL